MKNLAIGTLMSIGLIAGCNAPESSSSPSSTARRTVPPTSAADVPVVGAEKQSAPVAQEANQPEPANNWRVQGGNAVLTLDMVDAPQEDVKSALVLAHRPESGCKTEIGVTVSQGTSLGRPVRQVRASSDMLIVVDGVQWTAPTIATQYEHAQERGFWAPDDLFNALLDASIVRATLGDGLPTIEFPVHGVDSAVAEAIDNCQAIVGAP